MRFCNGLERSTGRRVSNLNPIRSRHELHLLSAPPGERYSTGCMTWEAGMCCSGVAGRMAGMLCWQLALGRRRIYCCCCIAICCLIRAESFRGRGNAGTMTLCWAVLSRLGLTVLIAVLWHKVLMRRRLIASSRLFPTTPKSHTDRQLPRRI